MENKKPAREQDERDGRSSQESLEEESFYEGSQSEDEVKVLRLSEALKKIVTAGVGAAFMTEEHIRSYLSEVKLPKDVLNLLIANANKSKEELVRRVGNETVKIISRIDFVKEASRFVEDHKFRVQAEIEVIKKKPKSNSGENL